MTHLTETPPSRAPLCGTLPGLAHLPKECALGEVPTPMLRLISGNPSLAALLPAASIRNIVDELMARRALDQLDARAERLARKADAIVDALRHSFTLTGTPAHVWRVDTVAAVLADEVRSRGWPDITHRDIHTTLEQLHRDPTIPIGLGTEDGYAVVRGLIAQGASTLSPSAARHAAGRADTQGQRP